MASYIKKNDGHLQQVVQTSFTSLGQNSDGKFQVGLVVAYGTEPVKVYLGDTQALAEAAAQEGLGRLVQKIKGGGVIIDIDEI